ncbi:MAG: DNA primase [Thermodesulfovibrionia bacterium]
MPSFDNILEEIKSRIDIVEFISQYVTLKRAGQNLKALCPFHSEKTPSFIVSPSKQIYHCFGCGEGGDIFTFLMKHDGISYREAIMELAKRAGVELRDDRGKAESVEKGQFLNINKDALTFFQDSLIKNKKAIDYLKARGIDKRWIGAFSIGYAPDSWDSLINYLRKRGYKVELMKKAGLVTEGTKGYYGTFRNRIIFPIFDLKGGVIGFGARAIDDSTPKYLNSPETPVFNKGKVLYGLNIARESIKRMGYILIMEGYIDVITSHIHGFSNAVAPLGTALTEEHGRLIKRFTDEAIVVFDSDEAGIKAGRNAAAILFSAGVNVRMLSLPKDEDPDSFLRDNGPRAFEELLRNPVSIVDFLIQYGGNKDLIGHSAIEVISRIPNGITRGNYIKLLSERLGINELFIIEELKKIRKGTKEKGRVDTARQPVRPVDEIYILRLLIRHPDMSGDILNTLRVEDFDDDITRSIYSKINKGLRGSDKLLLECNEDEKRLLTNIMLMEDIEEPEKALKDCLKRMMDKRHKAMLRDIQSQIRDAEMRGDRERLRLLQMRQNELIRMGGDRDGRLHG